MRILDEITDKPLSNVTLLLTHNEASELRDKLDSLIQNYNRKEWHDHVTDNEYQHEITIAIYNEVDVSEFNKRIQQLIINDK
jgi:helix-turn-helix protein